MRSIHLALLLLVLPLPAVAAEAVLEISQVCAVQTGCFPGDAPGFPVTITKPASYQLTSNLSVGPTPSNAIEIDTDHSTRLDLNGFLVSGPGSTSGTTGILSEQSPLFSGGNALVVRNGSITGFSIGLDLARDARIEDVRVHAFSEAGIRTGGRSQVERCLVDEASEPRVAIGVRAYGGIVRENRISAGTGIEGGRLVEANNVSAASMGISSDGRVVDNRVISGGTGLVLEATSTYSGNLVEAASRAVNGGADEGGNVCNGMICPAVTALTLRNADTDHRVESVDNGDSYSISGIGGCLAIQVDLNATATSVRYDWTAPGQPEVVAYRGEVNAPYVWAAESGWIVPGEVANCGCSSEMAQIGLHRLVLTPCSVDVNFGASETCVGNGGVEGPSRTVYFSIAP